MAKEKIGVSGGAVSKTCPACGDEHSNRRTVACSYSCAGKLRAIAYKGDKNPNWKGGPVTYTCEWCGVTVQVKRAQGKHRFCSMACANEWQRIARPTKGIRRKPRVEKQCRHCHKTMRLIPSRAKREHFCSQECHLAWRSIIHSGPGNPNWNGGTAKEPYPYSWPSARRRVIDRDGDKCISPRCRHVSTTINVHHIDYNKKNCQQDNLVVLCRSCNARANFRRDEWTDYFQSLLSALYGYEY